MKTRFIVIYAAVFLLIGVFISLRFLCGENSIVLPQHTTEINRLLIRLADEWESVSGETGVLIQNNEAFDYAVINTEGTLLCTTDSKTAATVSAATSRYDIIRDIERNGELLGRLIVHNPYQEIRQSNNQKAAVMFGGMTLLMLFVSVWYFIYLRKRIIEPFGKLKGFAEKVASGDLDTPLEMDRENVFGAFTESFDIMREELKAARMREEAAVRSRKELIAELSHDIKTPVASIRAMVEFLELTAENEMQKETLSAIDSKAERIDKLISNLFHAALEELEQLEVHTEELSSAVLAEIIAESDHLHKIGTADIKECVLLADRLRLEQIVGNIIANSYKYADTEITVSSQFEDHCLVTEFSDSGGGVPDAEIDLITEKFRRGTNAAGKDGAGIGLYISKNLTEKMGGALVCRNNGKGFTVELRFLLA